MFYKVTKIVDGDTFEVAPEWRWDGRRGRVVRPAGFDAPELGQEGYQAARAKLSRLILGREVELADPIGLSYERLLCRVRYDGKDLAEYFPEYRETA